MEHYYNVFSNFLFLQVSCNSALSAKFYIAFILLGFYSVEVCNYFTFFLSMERTDGFKHIQFMSNLSPLVYWLSNFIFDFVFFFIIVLLRIISLKLVDNLDGFLDFRHPFGK